MMDRNYDVTSWISNLWVGDGARLLLGVETFFVDFLWMFVWTNRTDYDVTTWIPQALQQVVGDVQQDVDLTNITARREKTAKTGVDCRECLCWFASRLLRLSVARTLMGRW